MLSKAVAAARTEQDLSPHVIIVPVVVAERFPQGVLPASGLALEATARDTGHGLHLVLELIGDGASCPEGGAAWALEPQGLVLGSAAGLVRVGPAAVLSGRGRSRGCRYAASARNGT